MQDTDSGNAIGGLNTRRLGLGAALALVGCGPSHALMGLHGAAAGPRTEMGAVATAAEPAGARPTRAESYQDGERYDEVQENPFVETSQDPLATFSLDVDTASYTLMRRDLRAGQLPRPESVRVEEFVNFFRYGDAPPDRADGAPFAVHLESAPSYFGEQAAHLLRVGVQAMEVPSDQRPNANLVFLIDVSGSMMTPDKLPLVKHALTTLIDTLEPDDTIGIVVYAGREAVVLEPTPVARRGVLLGAVQNLQAGGSTNGAGGIRAAYDLASQHLRRGGINRVVLCTDGDFNVGLTDDALVEEVARQRERGIALTALGFGRGNFNDRFMERLTNAGNGNYAYIDGKNEALRVLSSELGGTLQIVAKDVKVQVSFDPEIVSRFRLIGYENRRLSHDGFTDDRVDATEIGSGQFTTAYFEYELQSGVRSGDDPRSVADVHVRFKKPNGDVSRELSRSITAREIHSSFEEASAAFRFGAAVTELAEILRKSKHSTGARFADVQRVAREARFSKSPDAEELVELAGVAARLWRRQR